MAESFESLFEQSVHTVEMTPGSIVVGTVVDIDNEFVTMHVGLKSEGVIPRDQFFDVNGDFKLEIGDQVKVAMEVVDDGFGETRLSREKAKRAETWEILEESFEKKEPIKGVLNGKVKGGFTVSIDDVRAFLPGSLVDTRPIRDTADLEGQELEFQVIKLDQRRNNVVVSRRAILELENSEEREALLNSLAEGQVKPGIVKNLTEYGAFVDLGGIDGLLHVTDMAWKRVRHPSEVVSVGQEITVKVLSFDSERNRVSLGMKQLGDDPWVDITRRYPKGTKVYATVTNIQDYGCFAEIEEGVEGLVHVSEMDWISRNVIPSKVVTTGDTIEVMILDIDEDRRRVSLGIKQCLENPWEAFDRVHSVGDKVSGTIRSITDFGIFVGLDSNVDGLVHLSDMSWTEPGEVVVRRFSKGGQVDAVVLAIDVERERIGLGIKQLDSDVFGDYTNENPKGTMVTGVVTEVDAREAKIRLAPEVNGSIKAAEISRDRVEDVRQALKAGDEVTAKVINIDLRNRIVWLSIKQGEQESEAEAHREYQRQTAEETRKTTFGELIRSQLNKGKTDEEVQEQDASSAVEDSSVAEDTGSIADDAEVEADEDSLQASTESEDTEESVESVESEESEQTDVETGADESEDSEETTEETSLDDAPDEDSGTPTDPKSKSDSDDS
ncbi:MAG: 30S ribosomal protein S1 [Gammaproteobacteria bacterium]|nr:30S ribosomal protein S1 [Gammaproteobacteria bacterium]MYD81681.1 30S ribosomal protein S1 [Gammaproteobacteria bacterium]